MVTPALPAGDSVSFIYPNYRFAADSLRSGEVPFWNPYQYAGAPFLADNQSGVFYPPNLLLFLLRPNFSYRGIEWLVVWHFFFTGLAMYLCLRLYRPKKPILRSAALVGALAFMFSDVFITHIGNLNLIAVTAWLPLAFLGLHRAIIAGETRSKVLWAVGGGVALGLGTLAGHGQMTFLLATFLGVYALYETIARRQWQAFPLLALLGAVAIGVAAISLFPAAETLQHTLRGEFDYERSTNYALNWQALTGLVSPDFFGRGETSFWGDWLRVEVGYVGVITLVLALVGVVLAPKRETLFFVLAGLFFLLLALGPHTPLFSLLARWLPVIPFQVPARFVLLLDFCLAMLAAIGLDALLQRDGQPAISLGWTLAAAAVLSAVIAAVLLWQRGILLPDHPERNEQMLRAILVFTGLALVSLLLVTAIWRQLLPTSVAAILVVGVLFLDLYGLGRYVEID
ncbi:MAG: YfhO family protein [Chloroflexota bacterium]